MRRLNLGCGYDQPEGWDNLDKLDHGQTFHHDILEGLPFPDNYYDVIVTNHALHMFTWDQLDLILLDVLSKLKPGGTFRVIDFDPVKAFRNYWTQYPEELIIPDSVETSLDGKFCKYLTWYSTRKSISTGEFMVELLLRNGFRDAYITSFKQGEGSELDSRSDESYFVEGVK